MDQLRNLSARPVVVVDHHGHGVSDPTDKSRIGVQGPFGRERVVSALPIGGAGPVRLAAPVVFRDEDSAMIADPTTTVLGKDGVLVSRFLRAATVGDTRRL